VSGGVPTLMAASWAGHDVVSVESAFAFGQIWEEEDRRFASVASDDDGPSSRFGSKHGRGHRFLSEI